MALPDAFEKEAWGECTFRVTGGTMFAMTDCDHHGSGHTAVWVKADRADQERLVQSDHERYFVPPYMGPKGWVGIRLDVKANWTKIAGILRAGHGMSGRQGSRSIRGTPKTKKNKKKTAASAPSARRQ